MRWLLEDRMAASINSELANCARVPQPISGAPYGMPREGVRPCATGRGGAEVTAR